MYTPVTTNYISKKSIQPLDSVSVILNSHHCKIEAGFPVSCELAATSPHTVSDARIHDEHIACPLAYNHEKC